MSNLKEEIKEILKENVAKINFSKSVGVDGINGEKFLHDSNELKIIGRKIDAKCYKFSNYKENLIIKKHNSTRQISIPTQRDKLVLQGLLKVLKKDFSLNNTPAKNKIIDIKNYLSNYDSFLKIDIENFFPSISHEKLLPIIRRKANNEIFNLIRLAITQPTVSLAIPKKERNTSINTKGVPQGLPISSFLSDIFLQEIDLEHEKNPNIRYYRFVDDILILCKSSDVNTLILNIEKKFIDLDLKAHPQSKNKDKSSHGNIEDGFQYLGYSFINNLVSVRNSSVQRFYKNINKLFVVYNHKKSKIKKKDKNDRKKLTRNLIHDLNEKIAGAKYKDKKYGWIYYFSEINDQTLLFKIDSHVKNMVSKHLDDCDLEYLKNNNLKIKKISKAIFEIKKKDSKYVEHPDSLERLFESLSSDKNNSNKEFEKIIEKPKTQSEEILQPRKISKKINTNDFKNPEKSIKSLRSDVEPY